MSWTTTLGEIVGSVGLGTWGLNADQSWEVEELASATWGLGTLRTHLGWVLEWVEGVWVVGVWSLTGFLNVTVFAVFLLPLPQGGRDCSVAGEVKVVRGSLKLTIFVFVTFLKLPGVGREMASMCT